MSSELEIMEKLSIQMEHLNGLLEEMVKTK